MSDNRAFFRTMRPAILYLSLVAFFAVVCVVGLVVMYIPVWKMESAVDNYSGDGQIAVTSYSVLTPGYRIEFEPFDVSKPFEADYNLAGLPHLDAAARAGLHFDEISDRVYAIRGGYMAMNVTAGDKTVMNADAPIDDWNFSDQIGINVTYFNYQTQQKSIFELNNLSESAPIRLHLSYTPPEKVDPTLRAHVRLQVGGHENW